MSTVAFEIARLLMAVGCVVVYGALAIGYYLLAVGGAQ